MGELDDETLEWKERRIPVEANASFRVAFEATLKAGQSVLTVEDGKLYRLRPDGTRADPPNRSPSPSRTGRQGAHRWRNAFRE